MDRISKRIMNVDEIIKNCESSDLSGKQFRQHCVNLLDAIEGYDWSGIYRLEGENLYLDVYVGAKTDHTVIPVGRGVCGAAVEQNANQIVADVAKLDNYLSCSLETKAEIVVLIKTDAQILGQIDIDSHVSGRFTTDDEHFLEQMAGLIANRWAERAQP